MGLRPFQQWIYSVVNYIHGIPYASTRMLASSLQFTAAVVCVQHPLVKSVCSLSVCKYIYVVCTKKGVLTESILRVL